MNTSPGFSPLRINKGPKNAAESVTTTQSETADPYLARLVKLVPSEVIALYLTGAALPFASANIGYWALVCLFLVGIARYFVTRDPQTKSPQFIAIGVALVSFVIWIYAIGHYLVTFSLPDNWKGLPQIIVLVWTFVVPYFYKGD